jgi:hypothetical protein
VLATVVVEDLVEPGIVAGDAPVRPNLVVDQKGEHTGQPRCDVRQVLGHEGSGDPGGARGARGLAWQVKVALPANGEPLVFPEAEPRLGKVVWTAAGVEQHRAELLANQNKRPGCAACPPWRW